MPTHTLRRYLSLPDLVLTQILCVVGSSWVGIAASLGNGQSLTWMVAMVIFYLPMGASVICLSRVMPLEGGLYKWAQQSFGDLIGFMIAWNIWVYAICTVATVLFAVPSEFAFLVPSASWLPGNRPASLLIILSVLAVITAFTVRGLNFGKWVHNVGSAAILIAYALLIALPVWALLHGAPIHWVPVSAQLPPPNLFSLAIFGQMIFGALCGLEYIALLAGESHAPARTIGRSVLIASPVICAMFILGTASVLAFPGAGKINYVAPIPQTLRAALGNQGLGATLAATAIFLLELRLAGAASLLFTGATRLPLTAGWDHLLPDWFQRQHPRWLTPVNATLFTAALIVLILLLGSTGVDVQEAFQVLSNASLTHYQLAYMTMFAIPLLGTKTLRVQLPTWLKWTSAVGFGATLISFAVSAYPFVDVVNPQTYALKILGTTLFSNILGFTFYQLRRRRARPLTPP
jgi:amino acid transporter